MTSPLRRASLVCLLAALPGAAFAAGEGNVASRDPMQAPAAPAAARVDAGAVAAQSEPPEALVRHLVVIDGHRYVIERGQRLGVGDRLGHARIERIDDGVVWLRDARGVRQLSLFGGIVKRPSLDEAPASAAASAASRVPSGVERRTKVRIANSKATAAAAARTRVPQSLAAVPSSTESLHPDRSGSHPTR